MTVSAEPLTQTLGAQLDQARQRLALASVDEPRRTAETLLGRVLGCDRSLLFAHPERALSREEMLQFDCLVMRRAAGEPTQHLTGVREFFGREFEVNPDVLIPRPETELLVEAVKELTPKEAVIVDVGAGSGCIAATLALELAGSRVSALDVSAAALRTAKRNSARLGAAVSFLEADLLESIREESVDVMVSNPPYVAERDRPTLSREVRREPELALFAGEDGLEVYRRLIPAAGRVLRPRGLLALELGYDSLQGVRRLLAGWDDVAVRPDLAGVPRIALARRPG